MQSLWMLVAAVFYAMYGVSVKFAGMEGLGSWDILFWRSLFGVIVFYLMLRAKGNTIFTPYPIAHAVRALTGTSAIVCGIYSISHLNLGLAMTLNYTAPLFLGTFVVATSLAHHQKVNWGLIGTIVVGFLGVVVLLGPTIGPSEYYASTVGLAAGFFTAVATGFVKKLGSLKEPEPRIIFYLVVVGTFVGFTGAMLNGGFSPWTKAGALCIVGVCGFATLGQFCLTLAFSRGNMILSSALQYTVVLFSTLLGEIILREPATLTGIIGMIIIVCSGIGATFFVRRENSRRAAIKPQPEHFKNITVESSRSQKRT